MSKAEAIREAIKANPDKKPKEIAEIVSKEIGEEVKPATVSQQKLLMKKTEGGEKKAKAPKVHANGNGRHMPKDDEGSTFGTELATMRRLVKRLGKVEVTELVDHLAD